MTSTGLTIGGAMEPGFETVLTPAALAFVESLVRTFGGRVDELLAARRARAKGFETADGWDFLPETASVRAGDWKVAKLPADLLDRRVEITGPVERKMIINALNSGANVFMADFEDANSPTWSNQITGQVNLMDAVRRRIEFTDPKSGKQYRLNANPAVLFVRPRGWHLRERHLLVDGRDVPGGLFDFGLFFFHNAKEQLARGTGPYFYLPKMEHHLEARLWNDVFLFAQEALGVPRGSIKATVLIETLPAAFQMDEILYELREHSAGLNCGRWDYIFSFIKKRAADPTSLLPDRGQVTMDKAFLKAYAQLLIRTCHRRGVHAMGGMAAQIPIKDDPAANEAALARVRADKLREVSDGHDGTWVAHPGLVAVAREIFDAHMPTANQISRLREDVNVTRADLLVPHTGTRSEAGLRHNVRVGIQYIESWLRGNGCVPLYNLMEDAATAEIARAQVWQWVRYGVALEDGSVVTAERLHTVIDEEMARIATEQGAARMERGRFADARKLFEELSTAPTFEEFLTLPAYQMLG
ncbi:MAG: malate synthase A [Deltaproteobacteria bacterium]|nr:malate synthase A [Deltaproteobacteria bacterium]